MINEVVLEGIVVKTWKYADDLLFRLACYRDPDLPSKARQVGFIVACAGKTGSFRGCGKNGYSLLWPNSPNPYGAIV